MGNDTVKKYFTYEVGFIILLTRKNTKRFQFGKETEDEYYLEFSCI